MESYFIISIYILYDFHMMQENLNGIKHNHNTEIESEIWL